MARRAKPRDGELVKTQGVKRRDVNAVVRVAMALDLAMVGHDWQTIADQAGYASRGAAYNAVQRELDRYLAPKVEALRRLHQLRLQRLRTVYFPKAMAGDGWSADRVLRFDEREATLIGLDLKPDVSASGGQITVVSVAADVLAAI